MWVVVGCLCFRIIKFYLKSSSLKFYLKSSSLKSLYFRNEFVSDPTTQKPKPHLHYRFPQIQNPNQSPPMEAASSSSSNDVTHPPEFEVPDGWVLVTKHNRKGQLIKYYANVLGQKFYSESDLMRYINYSTPRGYSIYAPNFIPPATGPFAMRGKVKVDAASTSNSKHVTMNHGRREGLTSKNEEVEGCQDDAYQSQFDETPIKDEAKCPSALLEISGQRNVDRPEVEDCWSSTIAPK